jgi:hypothetical protein
MDVLGDRNKHVLAVCCVQACMDVLADRNNHPVAFYCTAGILHKKKNALEQITENGKGRSDLLYDMQGRTGPG